MSDDPELALLARIRDAEGTDIHRTKGKAPILSRTVWVGLRVLARKGWVALDESEAPLVKTRDGVVLGEGFASLTDAGRSALATAS